MTVTFNIFHINCVNCMKWMRSKVTDNCACALEVTSDSRSLAAVKIFSHLVTQIKHRGTLNNGPRWCSVAHKWNNDSCSREYHQWIHFCSPAKRNITLPGKRWLTWVYLRIFISMEKLLKNGQYSFEWLITELPFNVLHRTIVPHWCGVVGWHIV